MFTTVVRRTGALVVAGAVAGAVLIPVSANAGTAHALGAANAAGGPTTGPSAGAASWIAGQLENGLLPGQWGPEYPDYGLTIDAGLSTVAVGGDDAVVQQIAAAIGENLESYITGEDFGDVGSTYAGAAGKALTFAQAAGADPTDFGGVDLVARVESVTDDASGRITDVSEYGDNANTIGQAFAVRGLAEVGSAEAAAGTDFLLAQQCSEGFFRLELGATAGEDCDADPEAAEDTDVTAFALLALLEQAGDPGVDPDVDTAVAAGVGWLEDTQADNGAFGGGASTEAPNANSTGLAGWALGEAGAAPAAAAAAAWVAALQAPAATACATGPLTADAGALAYDQEAYDAGVTDGTEDRIDQWRRTTAQALPVLQHLDGVAAASALRLSGPTGFKRAGSKVNLTVRGLGPVTDACVTGPRAEVAVDGAQPSARVTLPQGTRTRTYTAAWFGTPATAAVKVLGAKKLGVKAKRKVVKVRRKQVVKVSGLQAGERVKVLLRGRKVDAGRASRTGRFTARFVVRGKRGKAQVKAIGHFGNRKGGASFRVVR